MKREVLNNKVLVLGLDGWDPRLTKKYLSEGKLPNFQKYIDAGSCREDLVMLGGHPTITPPMWTTLATGCYANVHGITDFYRKTDNMCEAGYNLDSRLCKAEQIWNVTAEAGLKTLVWHWPGSAWPASLDSENLHVVDGSTPGVACMGTAQVDTEFLVLASKETENITFVPKASSEAKPVCIIEDLDLSNSEEASDSWMSGATDEVVIWKKSQYTSTFSENKADAVLSSVKEPNGWAAAPKEAKEFVVLLSHGLIRRPALILKNEDGIYDRVAIYKNKKEVDPIVVCPLGEMVVGVVDEAIKNDKKYPVVARNYKLLEVSSDGDNIALYVSAGMDGEVDTAWHPKRLHKEVVENVGYPTPLSTLAAQSERLISECNLPNWKTCIDWQSNSLLHLMKAENYDVIFSHFHIVDAALHCFIQNSVDRPDNINPTSLPKAWMEETYRLTDEYVGKFIHLLDEGWTIFIVSDHGLVPAKHGVQELSDMSGLCTPVMEKMGYTVMKLDENGQKTGEIDWTKTKAIMHRCGHVYINLKGRDKHILKDGTVLDGIVAPEDKYELEEQIMTDLYQLTSEKTGHRIVSVALRNKDAVLLGQGGPEAGDICSWISDGYNYDHGDGLSTTYGEGDTSLSPAFIVAGKGFKKGFKTDRIIRQVDFAPTIAVLCGLRMPAQCEGAPVYQIFDEEL